MKPRSLILIVGAALSVAAQAADIYFWTDESGRTHLSDSVPAPYRKSALRIDSSRFELTPEQQRDAAASRAALASKASAPVPQPARPATVGAPSAAARAGPPAAARPGAPADCDALQREYIESLECFAPFVNANGSVKPEGFATCKSVVNPTLKCGSPKAY